MKRAVLAVSHGMRMNSKHSGGDDVVQALLLGPIGHDDGPSTAALHDLAVRLQL